MKRDLINSLMLLAMLLTSNAIRAYDFEAGGIYYNILSETDKTVEVTNKDEKYNTYSGEITIPNTISFFEKTYNVTTIGMSAFQQCYSLEKITLPNSITSIGDYAFSYSGIMNITIPENVTNIGNYAFCKCLWLESITIPDKVDES